MNSKTAKELRRISENLPDSIKDRLMREQYQAPAVRKVVEKALKDPETKPELREKLQNIKDMGYFDKKVQVENRTAVREADEWIEKEVEKAIKLGRIPHPKDDKELQAFIKKTKKNGRKKSI